MRGRNARRAAGIEKLRQIGVADNQRECIRRTRAGQFDVAQTRDAAPEGMPGQLVDAQLAAVRRQRHSRLKARQG